MIAVAGGWVPFLFFVIIPFFPPDFQSSFPHHFPSDKRHIDKKKNISASQVEPFHCLAERQVSLVAVMIAVQKKKVWGKNEGQRGGRRDQMEKYHGRK